MTTPKSAAEHIAKVFDLDQDSDQSKPTIASRLLILAQNSGAKFFRDSHSGDYYVAPNGDGTQVWRLDGQDAVRWLTRLWLENETNPAASDSIKTALFTLGALVDDSETIPLFVRVAWVDGNLWYDLGSGAVRIGPDGWKTIESPPILFRRFPHQLHQVRPSSEGDFDLIDRFLPVEPGSDESLLLKVWLLAGFSSDGPRPVLDLAGPQGSGKTTTSRVIKRNLDPSRVSTIRRLADLRDLQQQMAQTWALFADNLSGIGPETSDMLAAAVTGDATFRRKLYTNEDAQIFAYRRVLCLNGITHTAERPDLLDRALLVTLQRINQPMDEATFWANFDTDIPKILGGAFELLSKALVMLPSVDLTKQKGFRMADFARWGYAIAEGAGWGGMRFLSAYEENINHQHEEAVSASLLVQAVLVFMDNQDEWEGNATALKTALDPIARDSLGIDPTNKRSGWPQDAPRLSKDLFRMATTLAASRIAVSRPTRTGKRGRLILLRVIPDSSVITDTVVIPCLGMGDTKSDGVDAGDSGISTTVTPNQLRRDSGDGRDGKVGIFPGRRFSL